MKSATLERHGDAIRFNPQLLEFAAHYHYEPRPVAVYRGNEKGRVERSIRYIRNNFFAAREFDDLDDLNHQAEQWCLGQSSDRVCPEDRSLTVREAYEKEKPYLLKLPDNPLPVHDKVEVKVGKTPYIRFDQNDYSVPHTQVRKTLTVLATLKQVRIIDGMKEIAVHPRSFDKGRQIEIKAHVDTLIEQKSKARKLRGQDRLVQAIPIAEQLLGEAALRGDNLGTITSTLLKYLDQYGVNELTIALTEALNKGVPHPNAVRQTLQKRREERLEPPPLPIALPDNDNVRNLCVKPHQLNQYDELGSSHSQEKAPKEEKDEHKNK